MKFSMFFLVLFCEAIALGVAADSERYLVQDVANVQIVGEVRQDRLSQWMDGAGDINGDGFDDIIVSTNQFSNLEPDRDNYAYLIYGASDLPRVIDLLNTSASRIVMSCTDGAIKVAGIGDFDGDQRDDLALAASSWDSESLANVGEIRIVSGVDFPVSNISFGELPGIRIQGSHAGEYLGFVVSAAGDFNGDVCRDLLAMGSVNLSEAKREVVIIYGGTDVPALLTTADLGSHGTIIHNAFKYDNFANEMACVGDVNGDGFDDLLIGADADDDKPDRAYLIYGGTDLPPVIEASSLGKYGVVIEGGSNSNLGAFVAGAGDVNRDGFKDLLLSRFLISAGGLSKAGITYIVFGGRNLPGTIDVRSLGNRGITILGAEEGEALGVLLAGPGNWDGDQYPEIAIAPSVLRNEVYLMKGGPAYSTAKTIRVDQLERAILYYDDPIGSTFPRHFRFIGDVNGDGYDDLAVSDWNYNYGDRYTAGAAYIFYGGQFFETPTATPTLSPTESPTPTVTVTPTPSFTPRDPEFFSGWILSGEGRVKITPEPDEANRE